jgi:limonene 1,2-monooxygenase
MGPMHLAETFEKARDEVRYGMCMLENYREHINPAESMDWSDCDKAVDIMNESGAAVIGTPAMARAQIERLIEKSGGFGTYMLMGVDWAQHPAQMNSQRLFAEEVIPYFNGTRATLRKSYDRVMNAGFEGAETTAAAQAAMADAYKAGKA